MHRICFSGPRQTSLGKESDDEVFSHRTAVYNIASFGGVRYPYKGCDVRVSI